MLGKSHFTTISITGNYAEALYKDNDASLDDLQEAVTTLEGMERIARRVFGGTHPLTKSIESDFARATLRAREDVVEASRAAIEAMTPPGSA